ncbi:hypothetical protein BV898_20327, partial [Hypsibius exemplaris]
IVRVQDGIFQYKVFYLVLFPFCPLSSFHFPFPCFPTSVWKPKRSSLEAAFEEDRYPSREDREGLVKELSLPPRSQGDRRAKEKYN